MKPNFIDFVFVALQLLLFLAYLFNIKNIDINISELTVLFASVVFLIGILLVFLSVLQLKKNLSVFPTPRENSWLVDKGIYKYIRHPVYTGVVLAGLGYSVYSGSGYRLLVTILLLILFYFKSKYEEQKLTEVFDKYSEYKKRTGRFLPKF